jgi:hypothetical protein
VTSQTPYISSLTGNNNLRKVTQARENQRPDVEAVSNPKEDFSHEDEAVKQLPPATTERRRAMAAALDPQEAACQSKVEASECGLRIIASEPFRAELTRDFPLVDVVAGLAIVAGEMGDRLDRATSRQILQQVLRRFGYLQAEAARKAARFGVRSAAAARPAGSGQIEESESYTRQYGRVRLRKYPQNDAGRLYTMALNMANDALKFANVAFDDVGDILARMASLAHDGLYPSHIVEVVFGQPV